MNHRLKDYFRFSNKEKLGLFLLIVILIGIIVVKESLIYFNPNPEKSAFTNDSLIRLFEEQKSEDNYIIEEENISDSDSLFPFNPNNLSIEKWQLLGLSEAQAQTIKKYEAKGGKFITKSDVAKMYSVSKPIYEKLEPFILLPDKLIKEEKEYKETTKKAYTKPIIDINQADSATFRKLYGIGPYFAGKIVEYRTKLGGFHSISQLSEIWGIEDSLILSLKDQLKIESVNPKKLNINRLSAKELKAHPYFNWNIANSIEQIRKQHGPYQSVEEIKRSILITDSIYLKLQPYLKID
tara:strand:+ start:413 stop:1297 length:885 start_codon:yes stop_codon:yes gene_type:complete